ncbi:terpene synthase family protein [Micromonospora sp. NPDC049836]|uniref:terpene synthase family protein n=1 Tax=Micromonospora sp. NPDC049836 TaxID=3364274 RepID=UPI0037AEBD17
MNAPALAGTDELRAAAEHGRVCALAAQGQRELQRGLAAHPDLFGAGPFDAALASSIALAMAFSAPWCTAAQLRLSNRAVLWGFALDWQVDHETTAAADLDLLVRRQRAVAGGAPPDPADPLGVFLAELRAELAAGPGFAAASEAWRDAVDRTLAAMAREWHWRADGHRPALADYLANADNLACTVVNVAHWAGVGGPGAHAHLDRLVTASDAVQRALRLVNDLASYERDLRWGDLNALLLVPDRAVVERELADQVRRATGLIDELRPDVPREATYLTRQLGYTSGFYRSTDFWGVP